ncbi:hypothetical protein K435DRAFT_803277 [Dendrothele bispora CBS 962.96]|uniref:Uncharacterized protein n=1 Tax=Dendrothele bispora (strain CBS 962.96) TaxID=1314807 RepID=A0A4S8LI30_DENBC|nr:hypothetical protein K435DRAFT_803277 [Dendrothele bispora CBS 962.96]
MASWSQVPFSGAPPIPNGFNINPNLWQAGQWMPNPGFNWNSIVSTAQNWAPSAAWGRIAGSNGAGAATAGGGNAGQTGTGGRPAQAASRNPYKRIPKEPSPEYLAQPLSNNPLGLIDMVPREQLYGPGKDGALPETPWIWNPKDLDDENTDEDDDSDSDSESDSPSPASRGLSYTQVRKHPSEGMNPPTHQSLHNPPSRRASEGLAQPIPVTAQQQADQQHQPMQVTFSPRIVRTPDHYRHGSPGLGGSLTRSSTMPSIESQLNGGMEQLSMSSQSSAPSRRSSTTSSHPSRQSSTSSATTTSSTTSAGSLSGVTVMSDEPIDLLSPLVINTPLPSAPKALSRNHSAPATGGHGYSALGAILEGGQTSGSDHNRRRSKTGHKTMPSQGTSAASSSSNTVVAESGTHSTSSTPKPHDPHSNYASSRSHTTPTTGTTSASQYASNYASSRSQTAPTVSASSQSNGHYASASNYSKYTTHPSHSTHTQPSSSASAQAAQTHSTPSKNAGSSHTSYATYRSQTTPNSSSASATSHYRDPSNPPAGSSHTTYRSHTSPTPISTASTSRSRRPSYEPPPDSTTLPISNNPLPSPPRIFSQSTQQPSFTTAMSSASANAAAAAASSNPPAASSASTSARVSASAAANANKSSAPSSSSNYYSNPRHDDNNRLTPPTSSYSGQNYDSSHPSTPHTSNTPYNSHPVTPSSSAAHSPHTPRTPTTPGSGSGSTSASGSSGHVPLPGAPNSSRPPPQPPQQADRPPSQSQYSSQASQMARSQSQSQPPPSKTSTSNQGTYILPGRETYMPLPTPPPQAIEMSRKRMQEEATRKAQAARAASPPGSPPNVGFPRPRVRRGFWNKRGDHYVDGYVVYAPLEKVYPNELGTYPGEFEGFKDEHGRFVPYRTGLPELPDSLPSRGFSAVKPYEYFLRYVDD